MKRKKAREREELKGARMMKREREREKDGETEKERDKERDKEREREGERERGNVIRRWCKGCGFEPRRRTNFRVLNG